MQPPASSVMKYELQMFAAICRQVAFPGGRGRAEKKWPSIDSPDRTVEKPQEQNARRESTSVPRVLARTHLGRRTLPTMQKCAADGQICRPATIFRKYPPLLRRISAPLTLHELGVGRHTARTGCWLACPIPLACLKRNVDCFEEAATNRSS